MRSTVLKRGPLFLLLIAAGGCALTDGSRAALRGPAPAGYLVRANRGAAPRTDSAGQGRDGAAPPATRPPGFDDEIRLTRAAAEAPTGGAPRPAPENDEDDREEDDDEEVVAPLTVSPAGFPDGVRLAQGDPELGEGISPGDRGTGRGGGTGRGPDDQPDTDLSRPRARRRGGGGGPTLEEEEKEETDEDEFKSDLLIKLLGMEDSPIGLFGWVEGGFLGAPGYRTDQQVFGVNPNSSANTFQFQQIYFVVERLVDQSDKVNFGFRVDNLLGSDWIQYHMVGFNDHAWPINGFGWEPVQFFGQVHLPVLTEGGVDVVGGRFFSLPGYESAMAPARPLPSGSYMFSFSHPFTHFGFMSTWHVTDRLNVYNGAVNGWDRWIDRNFRWGYSGATSWDSQDERTNFTVTYNFGPNQFPFFFPVGYAPLIPNGVTAPPFLARRRNLAYRDNNALLFTEVLIHQWNDDATTVVEADQGYEKNIPGLGPGGTTSNAEWFGLGSWFLYEFTDRFTGAARAEVFFDPQGDRTGVRATYYETTLGGIYKPRTWLWFRPEVRFDWAGGATPYKNDTSANQFTIGFDTIFLF